MTSMAPTAAIEAAIKAIFAAVVSIVPAVLTISTAPSSSPIWAIGVLACSRSSSTSGNSRGASTAIVRPSGTSTMKA